MSNPEDSDADIILRSSDGVQFRVHKNLLSLASPVFSDMFSLAQPNSDPIDLSEPSKTINVILSFCLHPNSPLSLDSLSDIANLLQAADKYDMTTIQQHALYSLTQPKFLDEPLRLYAIASRFGAYDTAALAAQHVLRYPLLHAEYFIELEIVDGGTIYRILHYHKQCTAAALEVATDHTWIRDGMYVFFDCPEAYSGEDDNEEEEGLQTFTTTLRTCPSRKHKKGYLKTVSVHPWWTKFMATTKVALSDSICSETIQDKVRVKEALLSASQCSYCRKHVKLDFSKFLDAFVYEVEARVNEIKLVQPGAQQTDSWADSVLNSESVFT